MSSVAAVMTVRNEQPERLERRLTELAAQQEPVDEVVIAAPVAEHPAIEAATPVGVGFELRLVDNPTGERSLGLNLAARATAAELVIRVDARSSLSPQHVAACTAVLRGRPEVGVVGGSQLPMSGGDGAVARGIARALANPWALGGASYRRCTASGPVDTVYLGAFRRTELLDLGGYDERLVANEDFELCQRYRQLGLVVWLEPDASVAYESRTTLPAVASQYLAFGRSKVRFWRVTGGRPSTRQLLPVGALVTGLHLLVWAALRPRRLPSVLLAGAGAVLAVDAAGGPGRPASLAARLVALVTYPVVWWSFVLGIVDESLRRRP